MPRSIKSDKEKKLISKSSLMPKEPAVVTWLPPPDALGEKVYNTLKPQTILMIIY